MRLSLYKQVDFKGEADIIAPYMNNYQLTILITPEVQEDSLNAVLGKIGDTVQKTGGIIAQQEIQKRITLAYPIKQQHEAFQAIVRFAIDPRQVEALQKTVQSQKEVLRCMLSIARIQKVEVPTLAKAAPKPTAEEEKMSIEDIDKKLEEIFKEQ